MAVRLSCTILLLTLTHVMSDSNTPVRWSRQISSYTADLSDWIPLSGPYQTEDIQPTKRHVASQTPNDRQIKRQAIAEPRILAEPSHLTRSTSFHHDLSSGSFISNQGNNRPLMLQTVPSAPQNYLNDQTGFGPLRSQQMNFNPNPSFVSTQAFGNLGNFRFDKVEKPQSPMITNYDPFLKHVPQSAISQSRPFRPDRTRTRPDLIDKTTSDAKMKSAQSLQKMKYENQNQRKEITSELFPPAPPMKSSDKEEVQLLYVPVESLNRGQFSYKASPLLNQHPQTFVSNIQRPESLSSPFLSPGRFPNRPLHSFPSFNQDILHTTLDDTYPTHFSGLPSITSTLAPIAKSSTIKPKKLKPHQPPLAVFLNKDGDKPESIKVSDVLSSLKNAKSVAVLDSVTPNNAPKVFIGPSALKPPQNFAKFDLPYLSNLENSERKLHQLPFFVAPLSYSTPNGFAKIPFPSPHIGSVIVNFNLNEHTTAPKQVQGPEVYPNSFTNTEKPFTNSKPTFSYFTTIPSSIATQGGSSYPYQSDISFEPQHVAAITPAPEKPIKQKPTTYYPTSNQYRPNGQYFFQTNTDDSYENIGAGNNAGVDNHRGQYVGQVEKLPKPTTKAVTTERTTTTTIRTTTPSHLLDTHNPFSINQAFEFSSPLDSYEVPQPELDQTTPVSKETSEELTTDRPFIKSSISDYYQAYLPEIQYQSEIRPKYPEYVPNVIKNEEPKTQHDWYTESKKPETITTPTTRAPYKFSSREQSTSEGSSTTTTTRKPIRSRTRTRATTVRSTDSDTLTRTTTKRPARERRPLPSRNRYEPEKSPERIRNQPETVETSTAKTTRTRGRLQYKQQTKNGEDSGEIQKGKTKVDDLAYQRDVLHQNYPVTLMERTSSAEVEASTSPIPKISSTRLMDDKSNTEGIQYHASYSTEPSKSTSIEEEKENITPAYNPSSISIPARVRTQSSERITSQDSEYDRIKNSYEDESPFYESSPSSSEELETPKVIKENDSTVFGNNNIGIDHKEAPHLKYEEQNTSEQESETVPPTQNTHRIKIRPRPTSSVKIQTSTTTTEEPSPETTRSSSTRRPIRPITYRPATERRRTTMRIEEIEADLKTKPVSSRVPEIPDRERYPVYKPEPTTEPPVTTPYELSTTKRSQFRRRRPSHSSTTTTTDSTLSTRKSSETVSKGRYRTRKPIGERSTQASTPKDITTQKPQYNTRYKARQPVERYNRRTTEAPNKEATEDDDQDTNDSINRPKFVPFLLNDNGERDTPFKPILNQNDILDSSKITDEATKRSKLEEPDIITAKTDYEDVLISVTPVSNKLNKLSLPEIPPTLEDFVEQTKATKIDQDVMSNFESVLDEVMKNLEEQDEDEYSTTYSKKQPTESESESEKVISNINTLTEQQHQLKHDQSNIDMKTTAPESTTEPLKEKKGKRRGVWRKIRVTPVSTESFDAAESQYYSKTVNQLGDEIKPSKNVHQKYNKGEKDSVTTYRPNRNRITEFINENPNSALELIEYDNSTNVYTTESNNISVTTYHPTNNQVNNTSDEITTTIETTTDHVKYINPGDEDLGTGSPDPTLIDLIYSGDKIESADYSNIDSSNDLNGVMEFLFGKTSTEYNAEQETTAPTTQQDTNDAAQTENLAVILEQVTERSVVTEVSKVKQSTTEASYIPEEVTSNIREQDHLEELLIEEQMREIKKVSENIENSNDEFTNLNENSTKANETITVTVSKSSSSQNEQLQPVDISTEPNSDALPVTSMSTEVSQETEICYRGKCIKTRSDIF